MPARYSRISSSTSSTLSFTTYLVPSTRKATVSGCASTRSIRSGLSANRSPFRRVTRITGGPLARWGAMKAWNSTDVIGGGGVSLSRRRWRAPHPGEWSTPSPVLSVPKARGPSRTLDTESPEGAARGDGPEGSALEVDQVLQDL